MSTILIGNYKRIKKYAKAIDADGRWQELEYGGRQYRTRKGAVLNWWEKSGKILFQGHGEAAREFERRFTAKASARGQLRNDVNATETGGADKASRTIERLRQESKSLRLKLQKMSRGLRVLRMDKSTKVYLSALLRA